MNVKKLSKLIGVVFLVLIIGGVVIGLFSSFKTFEQRRAAEQVAEQVQESK